MFLKLPLPLNLDQLHLKYTIKHLRGLRSLISRNPSFQISIKFRPQKPRRSFLGSWEDFRWHRSQAQEGWSASSSLPHTCQPNGENDSHANHRFWWELTNPWSHPLITRPVPNWKVNGCPLDIKKRYYFHHQWWSVGYQSENAACRYLGMLLSNSLPSSYRVPV